MYEHVSTYFIYNYICYEYLYLFIYVYTYLHIFMQNFLSGKYNSRGITLYFEEF